METDRNMMRSVDALRICMGLIADLEIAQHRPQNMPLEDYAVMCQRQTLSLVRDIRVLLWPVYYRMLTPHEQRLTPTADSFRHLTIEDAIASREAMREHLAQERAREAAPAHEAQPPVKRQRDDQ